MYKLLDRLDQIEAEDVLPARDPARRVWRHGQTFPNRHDLQLRETQGPEALASVLAQRHSRATLFGYYSDWAKRLAIVALVSQGLVMTVPYVVDVSRFVVTAIAWVNQPPLDQAVIPKQSDAERLRTLEQAIRDEQNRVMDPDTKKIEELQSQYRQLKEQMASPNDGK